MLPKDLYQTIKGRKVEIRVASSETSSGIGDKYEGTVVAISYNSYAGMFIELDTGIIVNARYIVSIEIIEN